MVCIYLGVKMLDLQLQGEQLRKLVVQLEQQTVLKLQAGLSIEKKTTQNLKLKCEALEVSLAAEKQKTQS